MPRTRRFRLLGGFLVLALAVGLGALYAQIRPGLTPQRTRFKGVNWADSRDNFVNGVLYPSGLSSSDNYSTSETVAAKVVGQLFSLTGAEHGSDADQRADRRGQLELLQRRD